MRDRRGPQRRPDGAHQACRRGHYFVLIADKDHVFYEYTPKETSAFVEEMFRGYSGYVQADAKSVYDVLLREPEKPPPDGRDEVGGWAHCRRKLWEATCAKSEVAREGLAWLGSGASSRSWGAWRTDPPETIKRLRNQHLRTPPRGFFRLGGGGVRECPRAVGPAALGPRLCHAPEGRVDAVSSTTAGSCSTTSRSESALRKIAVGRNAWLFAGSDGHAVTAGHLMSFMASSRLHRLGPEGYLRDLFRVLAHWPRDRYLELAPKYGV